MYTVLLFAFPSFTLLWYGEEACQAIAFSFHALFVPLHNSSLRHIRGDIFKVRVWIGVWEIREAKTHTKNATEKCNCCAPSPQCVRLVFLPDGLNNFKRRNVHVCVCVGKEASLFEWEKDCGAIA